MKSLSNQQKQLLFDYCIGLASQEEAREAEALISCNQEAAELHFKLKSSFIPLESFKSESCPDDLVEKTIFRLKNHVDLSQHRLKQLLSVEQERQARYKSWFWGRRIAVAATFVIVGTLCVSAYSVVLKQARQKSWRQQCQVQLQQIWQAMNHYSSDYDGRIPTITAAAGEPWWKVGYQGQENHSNTRPMWLLVKLGYTKPADFVCPGNCHSKTLKLSDLQVQSYNDFPTRECMAYSFQISCRDTAGGRLLCRKVLMADLSPLFEELPSDYSKSFRLRLSKELLTLNSINHNRCGQNVLFGDGRIEFIKARHTSLLEDDIFTLRDTDVYQGCEMPSSETDFFLAP
jgi:Tfp pilus assembly protein PilV